MSNRAYIQQETIIIYKTKQATKSVCVYDDFWQGSIYLLDYVNTFFDDDLELLLFVLQVVRTGTLEAIDNVLISVFENETGIYIEDSWYDWDKIKPFFEKAGF
jgi:hypothetical protein